VISLSLSQFKIEQNNRTEKTRDLFKKIRDSKGTFHAKVGTIKDRNGMDLTEAEDIKKRVRRKEKGKNWEESENITSGSTKNLHV